MKKKILKFILTSTPCLIVLFLIILIPVLMILDFFGVNITDGYVEHNQKYAEQYRAVLNKNLSKGNGYVSLERILYFYLEKQSLDFEEIYEDNLCKETNQLLPISEVCKLKKYKNFIGCTKGKIDKSNQIDNIQSKPFHYPISFLSSSVTSFFMEERVVFDTFDVHEAWDFAAPANTPLYSVCDGTVKTVSFPFSQNITDTSGGLGNYIEIRCNIGGIKYDVIYGHLYPNSARVSSGNSVRKGQKIAGVGTTGYSTGNHLHYAVLSDSKYLDGMSFVKFE